MADVQYQVIMPDGAKVTVSAPEGMSEADVQAQTMEMYRLQQSAKISSEEQAKRDVGRVAQLRKELAEAKTPDEAAAVQRELQRMGIDVSPRAKAAEPSTADVVRQRLSEFEKQASTPQDLLSLAKTVDPAQAAQLAASGLAARGGYAVSPAIKSVVERVAEASQRPAFAQPGTAPRAPAAPVTPTAPAAPGAAPAAAPQSMLRVPTPERGYGTFQYGLSQGLGEIEAARALDMTKQQGGVHDLLTQRREAMNRIQGLFPTESYAERPSGLMVPDQGAGRGPRESFVQQPALKPSPELPEGRPSALTQMPPRQAIPPVPPPKVSPLAQVAEKLSTIGRTGANLFADVMRSRAMGALGAGSAAYQGLEALKHLKAGRDEEAALSGLGALGSGLMMIPTLPTATAGALMSVSPYLYRRYREATPEQTQRMLSNVGAMGEPAP